jgi:hypothetical protein
MNQNQNQNQNQNFQSLPGNLPKNHQDFICLPTFDKIFQTSSKSMELPEIKPLPFQLETDL